MQKLMIYFMLIVLVLACKKGVENNESTSSKKEYVSFKNTPETESINEEATESLASWEEFNALQKSFDIMYRADNNEDLVLAINDLLEKEKVLRNSTYPEGFDKPQVKSRQKVLRTFLLKVRANLSDNMPVDESLQQLLTARNAFRNQFNTIVNNKLDTKLLLEEN